MINRELLQTLREEITKALTPIGQAHGLVITAGSASFTPNNATFKVEVALKASNGEVISKERTTWFSLAQFYGCDPSKLDSTIMYFGHSYKIMGLLPKSRRCPVLAQRIDTGKQYKLPASVAAK